MICVLSSLLFNIIYEVSHTVSHYQYWFSVRQGISRPWGRLYVFYILQF